MFSSGIRPWLRNVACLSSLMSDEEGSARGIVWTLFEFVYIWVFLFDAPPSSDAAVLLLNQFND